MVVTFRKRQHQICIKLYLKIPLRFFYHIIFIYYPGHLATAVAFDDEGAGDYVMYRNRKYIVCDPTFINAAVGRTMPGMDNQEAQIIALQRP